MLNPLVINKKILPLDKMKIVETIVKNEHKKGQIGQEYIKSPLIYNFG